MIDLKKLVDKKVHKNPLDCLFFSFRKCEEQKSTAG